MHELAICERIVQVLEERAVAEDYARVRKVRLEIGPLAGVAPDALRFSFDAAAHGTLADNAELEIVETRGEAWCSRCARTVAVAERYDACPDCGGFPLAVTGGEELRIKDLEVE